MSPASYRTAPPRVGSDQGTWRSRGGQTRRQQALVKVRHRDGSYERSGRMAFSLTSTSFNEGDYLGLDHVLSESFGFGCAGKNISPQLSWSGAPDGTKSFALNCFDPDAPTRSGFSHVVVC